MFVYIYISIYIYIYIYIYVHVYMMMFTLFDERYYKNYTPYRPAKGYRYKMKTQKIEIHDQI
jgi:hypothetical protein